jgi:hypothetical protein
MDAIPKCICHSKFLKRGTVSRDLLDALKLKASILDTILPTLCHAVRIKFELQQMHGGCMQYIRVLGSGLEIGPRWLSAEPQKYPT